MTDKAIVLSAWHRTLITAIVLSPNAQTPTRMSEDSFVHKAASTMAASKVPGG
jgi:hypothetical protein